MKKIIFYLFFAILITFSCEKKSNQNTNEVIANDEVSKLKKEKESISLELKKYKIIEDNFRNEFIISPDSSNSIYNKIIIDYPNSFIKDFAVSRIKKIQENKKFWSKEDGWKIDKNGILLKPKKNIGKQVCN